MLAQQACHLMLVGFQMDYSLARHHAHTHSHSYSHMLAIWSSEFTFHQVFVRWEENGNQPSENRRNYTPAVT